jgi:parvulin-like peptidyl-prolyl isomerase
MKLSFIPVSVLSASMALAQAAGQGEKKPTVPSPQGSATPAPSQATPAQPMPAAPGGAKPEAKPETKAPEKNIPENAPVIVVKGLCAAKPAPVKPAAAASRPAGECKTVITRAEWERVINVVRPGLPAQARRPLAQEYVKFLALATAAGKAGLEKDPEVQERIKLSRMQQLASAYTKDMAKKAADVPAADIADYYKKNSAQFEQVTVKRIYVPKPAPVEGKQPDEAVAKASAQKLRDRAAAGEAVVVSLADELDVGRGDLLSAAAGEDFEKLQKEAFEQTGNKGTPPAADLGAKRRGALPPQHEDQLFKLKAGEISPPYEEASGFFIYKVEKKSEAPLDEVKAEIQRTLEQEKMRQNVEKVTNSVTPELNEAYFGPAAPPAGAAANEEEPAPPKGANPASTPKPATSPPMQAPPPSPQ